MAYPELIYYSLSPAPLPPTYGERDLIKQVIQLGYMETQQQCMEWKPLRYTIVYITIKPIPIRLDN